MKLNEHTMNVLKNFATINPGVVLNPGKIQKTQSPGGEILAIAELDEITSNKFAIYDLNQFLGNVTTMSNPDISIKKNVITIKDDVFEFNYHACTPSSVIHPPDMEILLKNPDVSFELPHSTLTKLLRLASMNELHNLSIGSKNKKLHIQIHDMSKSNVNYASTEVGEYLGDDFIATFKTEYLKFIPDDYRVEMKLGKFARFYGKNKNIQYTVGIEVD